MYYGPGYVKEYEGILVTNQLRKISQKRVEWLFHIREVVQGLYSYQNLENQWNWLVERNHG